MAKFPMRKEISPFANGAERFADCGRRNSPIRKDISPFANGDKGFAPLTCTRFLKKAGQKLSFLGGYFGVAAVRAVVGCCLCVRCGGRANFAVVSCIGCGSKNGFDV